jgi:type III pantothenate kinase
MNLFIELGNTNFKLAKDDGKYQFLGSYPYDDFHSEISNVLESTVCDCLFFSSVLLDVDTSKFIDIFSSISNAQIYPVKSTDSHFSIKSTYQDLSQLGVDRLLSMEALKESADLESFIVVSMGTALTVDLVLSSIHRGGFIVPGYQSSINSLCSDTARINIHYFEDGEFSKDILPNNTTTGIVGGVSYMMSSFINGIVSELNVDNALDLYITGGGFQQISELISNEFLYEEQLPLKGLFYLSKKIHFL